MFEGLKRAAGRVMFSGMIAGTLFGCEGTRPVEEPRSMGASELPKAACAEDKPVEASDAQIHIDAARPLGPVNQKIFGQFIKGADNYGIFSAPRPDMSVLHEGNGIWNPDARTPYAIPFDILKSYRPGILRYPDGLGVHNHDWKKTVGPLEKRGDWKFGIPEFMQVCEAVGAEPVFVLSEYVGTEQDAADLVEYLNMPATPDYPWAQLRAADGHPEPYGVEWFELGNESWVNWCKIGNSSPRSAEETGRYAACMARAMKALDPSVKCGIPMYKKNPEWDRQAQQACAEDIDFIVIHTYPVKYGGGDIEDAGKETLILDGMMAAGYTTSIDLKKYQKIIRENTGRNLSVAITEYNVGPTQQIPNLDRAYRFSLAAALGNGDYIGRLLAPDSGVAVASYWNWINGFFKAVRTYSGYPLETREKLKEPELYPMHYVFQLWGKYRGETLLPVENDVPMADYPGFLSVRPCSGAGSDEPIRLAETNLLTGARQVAKSTETVQVSKSDDEVWSVRFDGLNGNAFPSLLISALNRFPEALRPPAAGLLYRVSLQARWLPEEGSAVPNLGVGVMDNRGWTKSGSAIAIRGLQDLREWSDVSADYQPLPDTKGVVVLGRVEAAKSEEVNGVLQVRNLKIEPWTSAAYPARPELSSYATLSEDQQSLYMMVFNLNSEKDLTTEISWSGFEAESALYSEVNGTSASAVNSADDRVGFTAQDAPLTLRGATSLRHTFPAHSATGIILKKYTGDREEYKTQLDAPEETPAVADESAYRVLFIGDSITRHGANENTIRRLGWDHVAGMAASSEEKDYVHQFAGLLQTVMPDRPVQIYYHQGGGSGKAVQRLSAIDEVLSVKPHLVVVQLGEHEKEPDGVDALRKNYEALVTSFDSQDPRPQILATGVWSLCKQIQNDAGQFVYTGWNAIVEKTMRDVCERHGITFVSVSDLAGDKSCRGWGTHNGVKWHPNDKGHAGYARKLFDAFQQGNFHHPLR